MIVVMSWYSDESGEPRLEFGDNFSNVAELIELIRRTANKECRVYRVDTDSFEFIYDSVGREQ